MTLEKGADQQRFAGCSSCTDRGPDHFRFFREKVSLLYYKNKEYKASDVKSNSA